MQECDDEQENQYNENIQNNKKERKAAEDIRQTAIGSFAENKARKRASVIDDDESPKKSKKQRSSGSDALQYLLEKAEYNRELKRQWDREIAVRHAKFQQTQQKS